MSDFKKFAAQVRAQFELMSEHELYTLELNDPEEVWNMYLDSFPAGTNEIFRERRYYDGSYDRNVIRQIGHLAAIIDNKLVTIWDTPNTEYPFADTLAKVKAFVATKQINGFACIAERNLGYVATTEKMADGSLHVWHHFNAEVRPRHLQHTARVSLIAGYNTNIEMFKRALETFKDENVETVLDLISNNTLYRGNEFEGIIKAYQQLVRGYKSSTLIFPDYTVIAIASQTAARIRNTVIGTLIEDLNTFDLEAAVKRYESKVAPANYKRPTALITEGMVKSAMATIKDLGLESAMGRRYARFSDVSINDVLWVDIKAAEELKGGIESLLMGATRNKSNKPAAHVEDISIDDFLEHVLPYVTDMKLFFDNKHLTKLVSLTAPMDASAKNMFKWDNPYAWSYIGDVADSFIKARVKSAGGNVDAALRVSLAWHNTDDLDLYCYTPTSKIYFGNKAGILDVDANNGNLRTDPVENMQWSHSNLRDGVYNFEVHNYSKRNTSNGGFVIEVASNLGVEQFEYKTHLRDSERLQAISITVQNQEVVSVVGLGSLKGSISSNEEWGIQTQQYVPVSSVMLSPNYWLDSKVGNKHFMFILEGCKNPDDVRGFYNEYLNSELDKHRKVFEVLGSKTKAPYSDEQLSGLGFSSTRNDEAQVQVSGAFGKRNYNIKF